MNLNDCIELARFAHSNQRDKTGAPYIDHPLRVLSTVRKCDAPLEAQMAAVLHDVTEDTPFTPDVLIQIGVPPGVVEIVRLLDRNESAKTFSFASASDTVVQHYYYCIRRNDWAKMVKMADIADNLLLWRLDKLPEETQTRLIKKYANAMLMLNP